MTATLDVGSPTASGYGAGRLAGTFRAGSVPAGVQ